MKKLVLTTFIAVFATASAFAAWDWANPTYGTFATQAQMDAIAGTTSALPTAIAVDTDGKLLVEADPASGDGQLIAIDTTGGASGSIVVSEAAMYAVTTSTDLDVSRILVASDGTLYVADYDTVEDLIKVVRTPSISISDLATAAGGPGTGIDGQADIALDEANNRIIDAVQAFYGAAADGILVVALPGGAITTGATATQIEAVSGAAGLSITTITMLPSGSAAFFDEQFYGGSDDVLTISNPGATPTITALYTPSDVFSANAPGFSNINSTPQGDIIGWNQNSANGSVLTIIPAGSTQATDMVEFTEADIQTGLGIGTQNFRPGSVGSVALGVVSGTPNKLVVYMANYGTASNPGDNNIYTMTFNETSAGVKEWTLF